MRRQTCIPVPRPSVFWQSRHRLFSSSSSNRQKVLITGTAGQVGSELLPYLRQRHGAESVIATANQEGSSSDGPFERLDVTNYDALEDIIKKYKVDTVVHLAALLSTTNNNNPRMALHINNESVRNVLEAARLHSLRVFSPSTIAVFGPSTPKENPDHSDPARPAIVHRATKVHLELLGEYYHAKYGVDFRSLRYPGVVSSAARPGGGTADYACQIYHEALAHGKYECFLSEDTLLPMMYMPDLLRGTAMLMEADSQHLTQRTYNIGALAFTPRQLANSICGYLPGFSITYNPDFRQGIAETWPTQLDDSAARRDWGWSPKYDIDSMTAEMLKALGASVSKERSAAIAEEIKLAAAKREEMMRFLESAQADEVKV